MGFPESLDPTSPVGLDSPRLGDDQIRALKQLLADLLTLPTSPSQISATIGSVSTAGKLTITNGLWNGDAIAAAYGGTGNGFTKFSGPATSEKTFTLPNASDTIATLGVANTFTATQTLSFTTPSFIMTDTTALAKSLTIAVGSNVANFRESAGASGSLLALDLANNRVGIGTTSPGFALDISTTATGGVRVTADTLVAYRLESGNANAANRNWAMVTNAIVFGDFSLRQSNALGGNPISAGIDRFYIRNDGNVGIGTTSPTFQLQLSTDSAAKPSTNTWTIASDERMKDSSKSRPYTNGLATLLALPAPHYFTYNGVANTPQGEESVGWNSQELLPMAPTMVRTVKAKLTPARQKQIQADGSITLIPVANDVLASTPVVDTYGVNTHELQYIIVNAILELAKRVGTLEARP